MTLNDGTEARCDGCRKFMPVEETKLGFQFPPYYTGPIRLCVVCTGKILKFMINLHAEEENEVKND